MRTAHASSAEQLDQINVEIVERRLIPTIPVSKHVGALSWHHPIHAVTEFQIRLQRALDADFLLERELGGAGMSRVFVATERALQRRVVIKVLPPELAASVNVERFRREIQLAAQLQHPHIVPVLAAGDSDGLLWFSMPYIEGESLRGALSQHQRLPVRDVVRILHDVVDALAYAHARGIVHRDIKPDNILTSGLHALVTDFGVAKALSVASPLMGGTTTGMAIGTPAYMAPEQLAADPAADHRVDIYAVGLLAYELLTGKSPFSGQSPQQTLAAQLTQTPDAPHQSLSNIPVALSAIIMHCLEKDASKRPATAQALLAELDALPPMSSGTTTSASAPSRVKRWATLAVAAVIVLAVSFAVAQRVGSTRGDVESAGKSDPTSLRARDASRGGASTPGIAIFPSDTSASVDSASVATRDAIAIDDSRATTVPVVITKAETLAIIAAYRKRTAGGPKAPTPPTAPAMIGTPANAPSIAFDAAALYAEVRKVFADSMARAYSQMDSAMARLPRGIGRFDGARVATTVIPLIAPASDGRIRVAVSNFSNATGRRDYSNVGREVAHYLREKLSTDRYDVVDNETTMRAANGTDDRMSLGWGLRADYVVSGLVSARGDSLVLMTIFTDVRGGRFSRVAESTAPTADPKRAFDPSVSHVNMWLDSAKAMSLRGQAARTRPPLPPEFERQK